MEYKKIKNLCIKWILNLCIKWIFIIISMPNNRHRLYVFPYNVNFYVDFK